MPSTGSHHLTRSADVIATDELEVYHSLNCHYTAPHKRHDAMGNTTYIHSALELCMTGHFFLIELGFERPGKKLGRDSLRPTRRALSTTLYGLGAVNTPRQCTLRHYQHWHLTPALSANPRTPQSSGPLHTFHSIRRFGALLF